MIQNITNYLFIQHSETLLVSIAFYLTVLLLINSETIAATAKRATKTSIIF
jgi:hypothetical protein